MSSKNYTLCNTLQSKTKKPKMDLDYSKVRVLQKKILYVIGLSYEMADSKILSRKEYFGQYGEIKRIIINKNGYSKSTNEESTYSAYITFNTEYEAAIALLVIDNVFCNNQLLKASYGTTKYCNNFIMGLNCTNKSCIYQHWLANDEDIIIKNDNNGKSLETKDGSNINSTFKNQYKMAVKYLDIFNNLKKNYFISEGLKMKRYFESLGIEEHFPTIDTIYDKQQVKEIENEEERLNCNTSIYNYQSNYNGYSTKKSSLKKEKQYHLGSKNYYECSKTNYTESKDTDKNEEESEYILIKEPSRNSKKYNLKKNYDNNLNNNLNYNNYTKIINSKALNFDDEEIQDRTQIEKNKSNIKKGDISPKSSYKKVFVISQTDNSNTSGSSSGNNKNLNILEDNNDNNDNNSSNDNKMFKLRKKSRFSFVNSSKNIINIPEFITHAWHNKLCSVDLFNSLNEFNIEDSFIYQEDIEKIKKLELNL